MSNANHTASRICEHCKKEFQADPAQVRRGFGKCCSLSCAASKPRRPVIERFLKKVDKTDSCWLWVGGFNSYGYGSIMAHGRICLAHRVSWEIHVGPIPDGLCVLHDCRAATTLLA